MLNVQGLAMFFKELSAFVAGILRQWITLLTGGLLIAVLQAWDMSGIKVVPILAKQIVLALTLLLAIFFTWRNDYRALRAEKTNKGKPLIQGTISDVAADWLFESPPHPKDAEIFKVIFTLYLCNTRPTRTNVKSMGLATSSSTVKDHSDVKDLNRDESSLRNDKNTFAVESIKWRAISIDSSIGAVDTIQLDYGIGVTLLVEAVILIPTPKFFAFTLQKPEQLWPTSLEFQIVDAFGETHSVPFPQMTFWQRKGVERSSR